MKTLYLLGAGASAEIIPVVSEFRLKLYNNLDYLKSIFKQVDNSRISEELIDDLIFLHNGILATGTPDIFARSLNLQGKDLEYVSVKRALSFFLCFPQIHEFDYEGIDSRYLGFFSALLEKNNASDLRLHKEVKIATWNYDLQIPLSLSMLLSKKLDLIHREIGEIYHAPSNQSKVPRWLFRLNGYAGAFFNDAEITGKQINEIFSKEANPLERIKLLIEVFEYTRSIGEPYINFSWDDFEFIKKDRAEFFDSLEEIEILVIIGYSFPTFNRWIDREIFGKCKNLKKVFFQDSNSEIKSRILGAMGSANSNENSKILIKHISDLNQFYIPNEID